jgi:hypothetical protein
MDREKEEERRGDGGKLWDAAQGTPGNDSA